VIAPPLVVHALPPMGTIILLESCPGEIDSSAMDFLLEIQLIKSLVRVYHPHYQLN
jgi:hypothetical protein